MKEYIVEPNLKDIISIDFPGVELKVDSELLIYDKFVSLVKEGKKTTTVRYGNDKIRVPKEKNLPLFESKDNDKKYRKSLGRLEIPKITIKTIGELTEDDGINDGFSGKDELIKVIKDIYEQFYGPIYSEDLISIYKIRLL